ncbi:MAG: TROVE domain-containing protein [Chloroflexota bacterium]|nr:TROVE domain-containing protein [Chloroflexota bacterium]
MKHLKAYTRKQAVTPQDEPIPGSTQVPNSAGGFAWAVDDWTRLDRFLVLGSEGGTYYITERKLTTENAHAVERCIAEDGPRAVRRIVEISESGRAPKNDPAIFALALCATHGSEATKKAAFEALPRVCRTGTHLFHFVEFVDGMRGWGRGLRQAVAQWYSMPPGRLAYQAIKYQNRDGWGHRDVLRLAHPRPHTEQHNAIYNWIVKGWEWVGEEPHPDEALRQLWAFERAKRAGSAQEIVRLITEYSLPREAVPTQWLNEVAVWEALLQRMPMEAMLRNLATMTRVGLIAPMSEATRHVVQQLGDEERLRASRLHPIKVLSALTTYQAGRGVRGKATWSPVAQVVDALDGAFYKAFGNVPSTGKRWLLALDVSGSMSVPIMGIPGLSARSASAAMSMVTAATEPQHTIVAFSAPSRGAYGAQWGGGDPGMTRLTISPRQRLDDVVAKLDAIPMGGTDCSLPMRWALEHRVEADVFVVYTDSETWYGNIHPAQALKQYRDRMGIPAKMVVVAMTSNGFSIADPDDAGMLDVVGFDTATPAVMTDFVTGGVIPVRATTDELLTAES